MDDFSSRYEFGQTHWPLVFQAGQKDADGAEAARHELLIRYHEAVYRYLCARLNDPNAAGELFSQFAERVLEIHPFLERANPDKGRFRDYLRVILQRMVVDHWRGINKEPLVTIQPGMEQAAPDAAPPDDDADFRKAWVEELLNLAWRDLKELENRGGQPYHSLMLYKAQNPQARSEAIAQHFTQLMGRTFTAANVRQLVHRGQELLSDLLIQEVARTLQKQNSDTVTAQQVEEELLQLQMLDKPRKEALDRFAKKKA